MWIKSNSIYNTSTVPTTMRQAVTKIWSITRIHNHQAAAIPAEIKTSVPCHINFLQSLLLSVFFSKTPYCNYCNTYQNHIHCSGQYKFNRNHTLWTNKHLISCIYCLFIFFITISIQSQYLQLWKHHFLLNHILSFYIYIVFKLNCNSQAFV